MLAKFMKLFAFFASSILSLIAFSSFGDTPQEKQGRHTRIDLIESITRNPVILEKKWPTLKDIFPKCKKSLNDVALSCEQIEGVREITLIEGPTGSSTIEFISPATCEEIYAAVTKNLGKGSFNGDYCDVEWNLKRFKKGLSATLYNSPRDHSRIFFMIGFEQGP